MSKNFDDMSIHFDTVPALDRQTDRQTDRIDKTILRSACIACRHVIIIQHDFLPRFTCSFVVVLAP